MKINIKRIYEDASSDDGFRVLVDRLWPRGVSKERAELDEWAKEVAPSTDLRVWFDHKPARFADFTARYQLELRHNPAALKLKTAAQCHPVVTLLYGAKDPVINHATVLRDFLDG